MYSKRKLFKPWLILVIVGLLLGTTMLVYAASSQPFGFQVIRQPAVLMAEDVQLGTAEYWNTRNNFIVSLQVEDGWLLKDAQIYAGYELPLLQKGKPTPGKFPCKRDFKTYPESQMVQCSLKDE